MKSSQILANRGVKRILIVLLILYSVFMLIPLDNWPSSAVRDQVTIDHCFGIKEYRANIRKGSGEALERLNEKIQDTNSDMYKYIRGLKTIPEDQGAQTGEESTASICLYLIDLGELSYDSSKNRLNLTLSTFTNPLIKMREELDFGTQVTILQWIWLLLNYIFWPMVLFAIVEVTLWIKRGFNS